ncbi:PE family protein, partial [Mycobacterium tuberculosis]|nr:PE family protein [Mycobacterium tuberculosis]
GGRLIGNGGNGGSGGMGDAPGGTGVGGIGGLLLGLDGANAPASTNPLHTAQQQALAAVNAPIQAVTGRPLIGNGANGAPGSGAPGGHGGWLFGGGGTGGSGV